MLFALLAACAYPLPEGWEDAQPIEDFAQTECAGGPDETGWPDPVVTAEASDGAIAIDARQVLYRCSQAVEGFWRESAEGVDVLLQPEDMTPSSVAKCDCMYDFAMTVPTGAPGTVAVYRRSDAYAGEPEMSEIGTVEVE